MLKKWNQKVSEYVGDGHPDIIADRISNIVKQNASVSATETIINRAGVYISGETQWTKAQEKKIRTQINNLLARVKEDYGFKKEIPVTFNFVKQDGMLSSQRKNLKSGDQEVVYYHELNGKDVHFWLRRINDKVNQITRTYDYKVLVNMKNKTANLSISTTHKDYKVVKQLILEKIESYFGNVKINVCEFKGGSIFNDTGVTGRKLLVEKSGTGYPHGGGAYFGKDDTKAAVYGYDKLKKSKLKDGLVVYFPGDDLDKPNYIGKI